MASATNYPQTGQSLSTGVAWTTPGNIVANDGTTTYRSSTGNSAQLTGTNYGFAIPATATILGITLEIELYDTYASSSAVFNTVRLKKTSGAVGDNKAGSTEIPTGSYTIVSFGGVADLWGTTWTPAEINDSTFGAYMIATKPDASGDHYVDFFRITVTYRVPNSGALFFAQY